MAREILTDDQWARIAPHLPRPKPRKGRPYSADHRTTVEGILWIARTGAPWRDLPECYGKPMTVYQRFNRWAKAGVFQAVLADLADHLDTSTAMVDGTFVKVHQHGHGAPKGTAPLKTPGGSRPSAGQQGGLPQRSSPSPTTTAGSQLSLWPQATPPRSNRPTPSSTKTPLVSAA